MGERAKIKTKTPESTGKLPITKTQKRVFPKTKSSPANQILHLQRILGNREVQRLIKSGKIQAKLTIGKPNDKYEQEADRVADQVMRMPEQEGSLVNGHWSLGKREKESSLVNGHSSLGKQESPLMQRQAELEEEEEQIQTIPIAHQITPLVQRQVGPEEEEEPVQTKLQRQTEEEEEEPVQAKQANNQASAVTPTIESGINSLKGGGQPLPKSVRNYFEPRFGADFSQVKLHTHPQAAETAKSINAKAFTRGRDVVFGASQYSPNTLAGKRLLAHELTHVVQQGATRDGGHLKHTINDIKIQKKKRKRRTKPALSKASDLHINSKKESGKDIGVPFFLKHSNNMQIQRKPKDKDSPVNHFPELNKKERDELWLINNREKYGPDENKWPIHLRIERAMKTGGKGKGAVFGILRRDYDTYTWLLDKYVKIANTLAKIFDWRSDDFWLAVNLMDYGPEGRWPIHLQVELEMKSWGRGKGAVFGILRRDYNTWDDKEYGKLANTLAKIFDWRSDDFWLAVNLMDYGPEGRWPIHLKVEREMKGWEGTRGVNGVFNLLQREWEKSRNYPRLEKTLLFLYEEDKLRDVHILDAAFLLELGPDSVVPDFDDEEDRVWKNRLKECLDCNNLFYLRLFALNWKVEVKCSGWDMGTINGRESCQNKDFLRENKWEGYDVGTYISKININLGNLASGLTLEWYGPCKSFMPFGPYRFNPGAGKCCVDCNNKGKGSEPEYCTPKVCEDVKTKGPKLPGTDWAKEPTYFFGHGIAIHEAPSTKLLEYPDSHGCVRTEKKAAQIIHDNTRFSTKPKSKVHVYGRWKGKICYVSYTETKDREQYCKKKKKKEKNK